MRLPESTERILSLSPATGWWQRWHTGDRLWGGYSPIAAFALVEEGFGSTDRKIVAIVDMEGYLGFDEQETDGFDYFPEGPPILEWELKPGQRNEKQKAA